MPPGPEARRDRWSAVGLAVLALAYLSANRAYSLDTLATPGPGVVPLITGLALLLLAGWQAVAPAPRSGAAPAAAGPGRRGPGLMIGLLIVYAAAVGLLGFLAVSCGLVFLTARLMGAPGWARPALLAVGTTVATYVIFVAWLGVPLPAGLLR